MRFEVLHGNEENDGITTYDDDKNKVEDFVGNFHVTHTACVNENKNAQQIEKNECRKGKKVEFSA